VRSPTRVLHFSDLIPDNRASTSAHSQIVVHTSAARWCTFDPLAAPPRPS
jgi:hypothetical protein